jgi:hypothetical protein
VPTTAGHRLVRIEHQVEQRLLKHLALERQRGKIGRNVGLDLDTGLTRCRGEKIDYLIDDGRDTGRCQLQVLDVGETQHVIGEIDELLALGLDALVLDPFSGLRPGLRG